MTSATSVLQQVRSLGVDVRPVGGKLQLRPPGRLSPELLAAVKVHKHAIISFLSEPEATLQGVLSRTVEEKQHEIALMRRRMTAECNADDAEYRDWCRDQIECLQGHVAEIHRYLREGGDLRLPPCCKEERYICLIALRKRGGCMMLPGGCTCSMRTGNVD